MKHIVLGLVLVCLFARDSHGQQNPDFKFIAETLVVQADGTYKADPDLATLTFDISAQDKDLPRRMTTLRNPCRLSWRWQTKMEFRSSTW